jgi:hypothetical protein
MNPTRRLLQAVSWIACLGTILPAFLYLLAVVDAASMKWAMLIATLAWFAVTPCWMGREVTPEPAND